ncbi:activating transcription factor 7-interacting protein 2 isoform X2 [Eublepharis macularius]|uniref:Activating transcription factor 7-interacting protein 2 isoform X2 n=1 Tax=Eublepharis macularius TaxID=481883 RepID=A0AA97K2R1_EUBMA|nr:activating transcription factor 7-interacting protein 2 isoform X2 [Eublepharis macularius]
MEAQQMEGESRNEERRMEAQNKQTQDIKIDSNANIKKPLRARKTMTPSSRKQVEILKNLHRLGNTGSSTYVKSKMDDLPRDLPYNGCNTNSSMEQFLNAGSLQDLLYALYEKECVSPVSKPVEVHLYSKQASWPLDHLEELTSSVASLTSNTPPLDKAEKSEELPKNCTIAVFEQDRAIDKAVVTEEQIENQTVAVSEQDSAIVKAVEAEEPIENQTVAVSEQDSAVVKAVETEDLTESQTIQTIALLDDNIQFQEGNILPDDALRKKRIPEGNEDVSCKRIKSSDETTESSGTHLNKILSGLEKVKFFIQSNVDSSMESIDHKLQQLNKRIDRTQCLRKHEEITIRIIKKISRLDRRVNSVAMHQKAQLQDKANLLGAHAKSTILNAVKPVPGTQNNPSVPPERQSVELGEAPSRTTKSFAKETCLNMKTSNIQAGNSAAHNGRRTETSPDVQQRRASSNADTSAEHQTPHPSKNLSLIDLTKEDDTNKEAVSVKPSPQSESIKSEPHQPTAESSNQVPESFSHLPPLPKIHLNPEHMNDFKDTRSPQKLELAVVQVQNPKGVAIQWNIRRVDPRCAPIENFHLFTCFEGTNNGIQSSWMKSKPIKALPLPMACSLSLFTPGKYYFTMQSMDIFHRFGPFCDIQSISVV